ncbi:MAG: hypothetical protein H7Y38_11465, partial [Armatimonadetes bacterium]|nr:hypothetical protein [Armatimonadota bacterium]
MKTNDSPDAAPDTAAPEPARPSGVTFRAVCIGVVFALLLCAFTPYNDFLIAATYIAGTQFPIGAVFVELLLVGVVNVFLRRFAPKKAFSKGELLTVWSLILVASGLPSSGMMRYFLPNIAAPHYMSDTTNNWESKVWSTIPDWMKITDTEAATAFAKGYPRGSEHIPWDAWASPLFFWSILAFLFLLASFCVASLLRKQWVENEKFSFPLVALPMLLAEDPEPGRHSPPLLRSPLFWLAVIIVTTLHTIRGLHVLYPSIPDIVIHWDMWQSFTTRPLNQIHPIDFWIYPLVIGISYLLSAEVCFSLWFFHLFYKAEILVGAVYNFDMPGPVAGYSYKGFHALEAFGGGVALLIWTTWSARRHIADVWEKATGGDRAKNIDDSRELLSYRTTLFGLIVSYGGIGIFLWAAGLNLVLIVLSLLTLTLALVVISWVVCQAGLLFMAQPYGTVDILAGTVGTAPFKTSALFTLFRWENMFIFDTREMLAPSLIEAAKVAEDRPGDARKLLVAIVLVIALGWGVSLYFSLWLPYMNGGGYSLKNAWTYQQSPSRPLGFAGGIASVPKKGDISNWFHLAGGFTGVLLMLLARARMNFGLHPIGFLSASVYSMHMLWFSIFIGWLGKVLIQRYGGMKGYLAFLPFSLGLVLGDSVNAVLWIILGYATQ